MTILKQKDHAFGKDVYLLGKDKDGIKYWLEQGTFDCGWYWGIGYIETYQQNWTPSKARDINSHQHFNGLFFNRNKNGYDAFKEFFTETTLTDKEIWQLVELMKTAYTMREYSDTLHRGGAHYTTNPCQDIIKNEEEYKRINEIVIPAILAEVYELLSPKE